MKMRIKVVIAAALSIAVLLAANLLMPRSDNGALTVANATTDTDAVQAATAVDVPPVDDLVEPLRQRLLQHPEDVDGWVLLGRSYHFLQRWQEASAAFARARALGWQGDTEADNAMPRATLEWSVAEGVKQAISKANSASAESSTASIGQP